MSRSQIIAVILSVCGFLAWADGSSAEEPKSAPPAGVRISIDGNSWSVWPSLLLPIAKEAGIQGQIDGTKEAKQRLEKGELDVMTFGTHGKPEDGNFVAKTVELGLKHNPNFRFYQQAAWPVGDARWRNKANEIKTKDDYDTTKIDELQAATDEIRKGHEGGADGINKALGKRVVFIVPVGDALVKLRAMIVAGKFPGVKRQSELFPDAMPHLGGLCASLQAYCHFSAIYRIPPPAAAPLPDGANQGQKDAYAQQEILRQIAWETVSKYPYAGVAVAQDPKSAPDKKLPAGLRVMSGGHSWSTENSAPLCQAAGITGHMKLNKQGLNSGRIEDLTPLLEKGEIDAYVWQNSLGAEFPKFLPTLVELGPKHNPNFRVLMQMPWLVHDGRQGVKSPEEYETTDLAEYQTKMEKYRKQQEAHVDEVNAKAGKRVVFLVPLGDGMLEVRKMIVAGKFPGVTKVSGSVLGGDIMPHQGLLGMRLGAYMHFAALYRMSPEGLKFPGKEGDGLTDEQRPILQKLAWDMVSKYPYAGIAKYEPSAPSKDEKKPAPTPAATTVPEALKGWKATQDLPDDSVVTDYNAYIEKLPKAERPGVSDVKYYLDGTGRHAVAVLVNVGDTQWTHLLVYDKQNKRTDVTKFVAGK